jgi:hypothetical protein
MLFNINKEQNNTNSYIKTSQAVEFSSKHLRSAGDVKMKNADVLTLLIVTLIKHLDKWMVQNRKRVCLITKESEAVTTEVDGKIRHQLRKDDVSALDCENALIESH